jgi:hypothetical protein
MADRYIRICAFKVREDVWVEKVDSREIQDLQLAVGNQGGATLFILKPHIYELLLDAMERGINE